MKREAIALVAAGVCDADTVDVVVREGFGARTAVLGPMEQSDLVGTNLTLDIAEVLYADLDRTPGPHPYLRDIVAAGKLGMKTGEGLRKWTPAQADAVRARACRVSSPSKPKRGKRRGRTRPSAPPPELSRRLRRVQLSPPTARRGQRVRRCIALTVPTTAVEDIESSGAARLIGFGLVAALTAARTGLATKKPPGHETFVAKTPKSKNIIIREGRTCRIRTLSVRRRTLLQAGLALGASQAIGAPFVIKALGDEPVKIGMVDPLTGVLSALAQSEVDGAKYAEAEINKKGGILGRQVQLLVEDSANDVGTGVQKTRKLIDRDQVNAIIGDVNSGIAYAMSQVTNEKKVFHIVAGGHTDPITGTNCKWNVFRVCNTTTMDAEAVTPELVQEVRQEMVLRHARLRLRPHAAGRLRQGAQEGRRHL